MVRSQLKEMSDPVNTEMTRWPIIIIHHCQNFNVISRKEKIKDCDTM
jgi:hypothetical protein